MRARIRAWLERTHGPDFELTRHFLARLFDSELVATPGEWLRVAIPAFAIALCGFVLLAPMYRQKYGLRTAQYRKAFPTAESLAREVRADEQSMAALLMLLTAIVAAVFWRSLFPTVRDALALASLPVKPRQIFTAKLAAVTVLFAVYAATLTVPVMGMFTSMSQGALPAGAPHFLATLICWGGVCVFAWFGLFALQGLLLIALPTAWFERISTWTRGLVFGAAIAAIPIFRLLPAKSPWWPPGWFAALWAYLAGQPGADARAGLVALLGAPALALAVYAAAYHRYRAVVVESAGGASHERGRWLDALIRRVTPDAREQAMLGFVVHSLTRGATHQFLLLALAAIALSMNIRVVSDVVDPAAELRFAVVFGPISMAVAAIAGLRYLFTLPVELRANWMFRLTEREGRESWMRAVERFVPCCAIAPAFAAWFPAAVWSLGIGALIAYAQGALFAMLVFEVLFRHWRKPPFACSYLPGKQPVWRTLLVFFYAASSLSAVAGIFLSGVTFPPVFFLSITVLAVLWQRARERRRREWAGRPLLYAEAADSEVEALDLNEGRAEDALPWTTAPEPSLFESQPEESVVRRAVRWVGDLPGDVWYAVRGFAAKPGFPLGAILTIALGLGLNAAFFAIYDAVYLKKAAVIDPDSLYDYAELVSEADDPRRTGDARMPSVRQYEALRSRKDVVVEAAGRYQYMARHGERILLGLAVTDNYFSMLGARPALGRLIGEGDRTPVLVLSHRAWRMRFGSDAAIIGRTIEIRRARCEVIGVAAPEFHGVSSDAEPDFWLPVAAWQALENQREPEALAVLIRLHPRYTEQQAKHALIAQARHNRPGEHLWAISLRSASTLAGTGNLAEFTLLIFLTFAFTMAIPCANVANMMLARGLERQRELGVRLALGASRGRLVRQLLAEALLVSAVGGAVGLLIARAALDLAKRTLESTLPWIAYLRVLRLPDMEVDARVFVYMLAVAAGTSVAFALLPALESARWGASYALRREVAGIRTSWLRDALVAGQVAVCLMLIACAALLLRGSTRFTRTDPGFDAHDLHAIATLDWRVSPEVERTLRAEPWPRGIARSAAMPTEMRELTVRSTTSARETTVRNNTVSMEYFDVLRIPVVRGRAFSAPEAESKAAVAVVSEAVERLLWPGESALGKAVRIDRRGVRGVVPRASEFQVIGVVRERAQESGEYKDGLRIYFPDQQARLVLVRGNGDTRRTSARIERFLMEAKSETRLEVTIPLEDLLYLENYAARAGTWVGNVLGVIALVLTASGMYGVMSFLVGQRSREVSIRVALGATRGSLLSMMVHYSGRLVAAGLTAGLVLAVWTAKLLAAHTAYILVSDAWAYAAGAAVVGLVAVAASIPPAVRASRTDPMPVLRVD